MAEWFRYYCRICWRKWADSQKHTVCPSCRSTEIRMVPAPDPLDS